MRRAALALSLAAIFVGGCGTGPAAPSAPPGEILRFTSADGVDLVGELRGSGETGVVLAHMFPTDRTSWADFADLLADEGYLTLAFDFRGYGDSEGEKDIASIWQDVLAAVEAIRDEGATNVVVVGASMGGTAALVAASRGSFDGVVTLSAPGEFMGLAAPPDLVAAVDEPKLFLAGEGDGQAGEVAQAFYNVAPPPKRVEIIVGSEHGTELLSGGRAQQVRELILVFLHQYG